MSDEPAYVDRYDYGKKDGVRYVDSPVRIHGATRYVREDIVQGIRPEREKELLEANNTYLERARVAERRNNEALKLLQEWFEQEAGDNSLLKITQARNILRGEK